MTALAYTVTTITAHINHSTISRWERGERDISQAAYDRLAGVLARHMAKRWAA